MTASGRRRSAGASGGWIARRLLRCLGSGLCLPPLGDYLLGIVLRPIVRIELQALMGGRR